MSTLGRPRRSWPTRSRLSTGEKPSTARPLPDPSHNPRRCCRPAARPAAPGAGSRRARCGRRRASCRPGRCPQPRRLRGRSRRAGQAASSPRRRCGRSTTARCLHRPPARRTPSRPGRTRDRWDNPRPAPRRRVPQGSSRRRVRPSRCRTRHRPGQRTTRSPPRSGSTAVEVGAVRARRHLPAGARSSVPRVDLPGAALTGLEDAATRRVQRPYRQGHPRGAEALLPHHSPPPVTPVLSRPPVLLVLLA